MALRRDQSGQDLAEYAILLALIAIIVVISLNTLAPQISASFNNTASAILTGGS
ncbi:MAG: pilus assembly protein [Gemmatimonadota bacterium]